jgi:predicted O-methyltransferase YrrM
MTNTNEYQFTQDWFSWAPSVWENLIPHMSSRRRFLEVGSFEGRSAVWIVENMLEDGGELLCIDTWAGGEDHKCNELSGAYERFAHNISLVQEKFPRRFVEIIHEKSVFALAKLLDDSDFHNAFDFVYIDGSHTAPDVLTDACMSWPLVARGGFVVFDDYAWGDPRDVLHRPKLAVDSFCNTFAEQMELVHAGQQFIVRKK